MRNISNKGCTENQNTHIEFSNFFPENCAVHEITWKNIIRPQMKIWRMRISCWITKATNVHSQYAILIYFPLQECLHERASILHCKYIACLVTSSADKHKNAKEIRRKSGAFTFKNKRTALIINCKCGK